MKLFILSKILESKKFLKIEVPMFSRRETLFALGRVPIYHSHSLLFAWNDIRSRCILIRSSGFTIRVYSQGEANGERIQSEKNAKFEQNLSEKKTSCIARMIRANYQSAILRDGQTDGSIIAYCIKLAVISLLKQKSNRYMTSQTCILQICKKK